MALPLAQPDFTLPATRGESSGLDPLSIAPATKARIRLLVVDDEHTLRESCATVLRQEGYDVTVCGRGLEARDCLQRRAFDIVLVDLCMPQVDGLTLLRTALATHPDTIVIVMTGNPSVDSSVEALRQGAWDYLPKPFSATHLQILIGRAIHTRLAVRSPGDEPVERAGRPGERGKRGERGENDKITLLGVAPAFRRAVELARKVAATDASVFITGESGSGKELIAQYIHHHSPRANRPFLALNCAALPEGLLESEMFGHKKGAFTGAVRDKPGLLEAANGGTLFLDELIEMSKPIQAKLLRVIQDGVVRRVGSESPDARVDVRFIAATNGDVEAAVAAGVLRQDLYYRLQVVPIRLPPLRERPKDIPLLANYFLSAFWVRHRGSGLSCPTLSDAALGALQAHRWRGNVRELQNVIEHVAVFAEPASEIRPTDLQLPGDAAPRAGGPNLAALITTQAEESYHAARDRVIAQFERQYLTCLVTEAAGNMAQAARIAGVDRTTLYRMMERHALQRTRGTGSVVEREPAPVLAGAEPSGCAAGVASEVGT